MKLTALVATVAFAAAMSARADNSESRAKYADPRDAKALTEYGAKLVQDDHAAAALPFLLLAVDLEPSYTPAYLALANAYAVSGRNDKAAEMLNRFLTIRPFDPERGSIEKRIAALSGETVAKPAAPKAVAGRAAPLKLEVKLVSTQSHAKPAVAQGVDAAKVISDDE